MKYGYQIDRDENGFLIFNDLQKHILQCLSEIHYSSYNNLYTICLMTFPDSEYVKYIFWADLYRLFHAGIIGLENRMFTIIDEGYNLIDMEKRLSNNED